MEAADFINKCLQRKPANRLGLNGPNEVKQHVWLRDVEWTTIIEMKYNPTFLPSKYLTQFSKQLLLFVIRLFKHFYG